MERINLGTKLFLKFDNLTRAGVFHFTSTRKGWNGNSRFTGDDPEQYATFQSELTQVFSMNATKFIFPRQVHGDRVVCIDRNFSGVALWETDALITNQAGICICVQTADCVPVLLFDPVENAVAAIHAGWRGTVAKIVSKTVGEMQCQFGSQSQNIIASIGPSIQLDAYEVGEDVREQIQPVFKNYAMLFKPSIQKGKYFFDLWEANRTLLLHAGLLSENIEVSGLCSFSHPDLFYSARRDGVRTGRMVSGIMVRNLNEYL